MKESITRNELQFGFIVSRIFKYLGYKIKENEQKDVCTNDLIAKYEDRTYKIGIKYYLSKNANPIEIMKSAILLGEYKISDSENILVISNVLEIGTKQVIERDLNITILDLSNLLYVIKNNQELYDELLGVTEFFINDLSYQDIKIPYKKENGFKAPKKICWKEEFEKIVPGKEESLKYEDLCIKAIRFLFTNNLTSWKKQYNSNNNIYRFDLICRIKNNYSSDFFETIQRFFNTKYLIFEFKNYAEHITPTQIYTTEKYLYSKALRSVAIIISRRGLTENALVALKGSLRESGKLIIVLTDEDVIKMTDMKESGNNPADYLSLKIDDLLTKLEK